MAKGGYTGGGTQISPGKNPHWFGNGGVETEEFRLAKERHEKAQARLARLLAEGPTSNSQKYYRRGIAMAEAEVQRTRPAPVPARAKPSSPISAEDEQRIGELKRDLAAFATQARRAIEMHEEARQKLIKLLGKHALAPENYPETRKLSL